MGFSKLPSFLYLSCFIASHDLLTPKSTSSLVQEAQETPRSCNYLRLLTLLVPSSCFTARLPNLTSIRYTFSNAIPVPDLVAEEAISDDGSLSCGYCKRSTTVGCSVWWEVKNRKNRIKEEWDLALINVLTISVCNAAAVWLLAPCRSYGMYHLLRTMSSLFSTALRMLAGPAFFYKLLLEQAATVGCSVW